MILHQTGLIAKDNEGGNCMKSFKQWFCLLMLVAALLTTSTGIARADGSGNGGSRNSDHKSSSDGGSWYVGLTGGGVFAGGLDDQNFGVSNAGVNAAVTQGFSLGNGPTFGGQVGYDFKGPRVEGEFVWQNVPRPHTTLAVSGTGVKSYNTTLGGSSVDTYSFFVNGYYDFNHQGKVSPYVGVGLGVTSLNAGSVNSGGPILQAPGLNQSVFAYQAKVGVSYKLNDAAHLFLQYRYIGTGSFNYGGADITIGGKTFHMNPVSGTLGNSSVEVGVRVKI